MYGVWVNVCVICEMSGKILLVVFIINVELYFDVEDFVKCMFSIVIIIVGE